VLASVAKVIRLYGVRTVADQYMAATVVDRLRSEGIWVRTEPMTATSKTPAFSELRAAWPPEPLGTTERLAALPRSRPKHGSSGCAGDFYKRETGLEPATLSLEG
jgi:hypothetical protein